MSDLAELKERAEKEISLEYDAWAKLSERERGSLIYQKMLSLLQDDERDIFRNVLMIARDVWETGYWRFLGHESFVEYLCDVGGKYRNEDGTPSGTAYDLSGFVTIAWPVLEQQGMNPVEVGATGWSKARLMVSTIRQGVKMLTGGEEVRRPEDAQSIVVREECLDEVKEVIRLGTDEDVSWRSMMDKVCERRIPAFKVEAALQKDGTWNIKAAMTDQQFGLFQRMMERYIDVIIN